MSEQYPRRERPPRRPSEVTSPRPSVDRIPLDRDKTQVSLKSKTQRIDATQQHAPPSLPPVPFEPDPRSSALYVPWWAFALVILVVAGLTCGLWTLVLANRGDAAANLGATPTPIFIVITATPTLGGDQPGTGEPSDETTLTPTATDLPFPEFTPTVAASTEIQIGSMVVITGTEGEGLAIRQGPGLSYSYFFVGNDGDVFIVEDGPREADGYVWWYITDPDDPNRAGWAAVNFLQAVQP